METKILELEKYIRDNSAVEFRKLASDLTPLEVVELIELVLKSDDASENESCIGFLIMQLKIALKSNI